MIKSSDIKHLERYKKGLTNSNEDRYVYSLFSENEEKKDFKQLIQKDFYDHLKKDTEEDYNLSFLLDKIYRNIHIKESQKKDTVVRKIYNWYSVAAAILIIPILIAGGIWFTVKNQEETLLVEEPVISTLIAPLGSRINFSLPDGTKGWLNSGSSLKYCSPFNANRQVAISGEAWFDVAHDTEHPFEIAAGNSKVKVLGTKFNLCAYPQDKYVEVVLKEGSVEFTTPRLSSGIKIKPNERLIFSNDSINIDITDASKFAAWIDGKLVFRGDPMTEVARRIERWYNIDVELVDKELEKYVFRGTFQDDSIEEVLNYLSMTSPIRYRIIGRKILDDGTIVKKKVLLYKKRI